MLMFPRPKIQMFACKVNLISEERIFFLNERATIKSILLQKLLTIYKFKELFKPSKENLIKLLFSRLKMAKLAFSFDISKKKKERQNRSDRTTLFANLTAILKRFNLESVVEKSDLKTDWTDERSRWRGGRWRGECCCGGARGALAEVFRPREF